MFAVPDTRLQISVLAASAAKNALDSFKVGDPRFDVASAVAIAQCKFGSALAAEPVMRLLAMAVISIGTEHLPAVKPHVQDKNALIAAVSVIDHHQQASVVQSLREIVHNTAHSEKKTNATSARTGSNVASQSTGGFGIKHVILALTVSAIGGKLTRLRQRILFGIYFS